MTTAPASIDLTRPDGGGYFTRIELDDTTLTVTDRHTDGNAFSFWSHTFTAEEGFADPQGYAVIAYTHEVDSRISSKFAYAPRSRSVVGETFSGEKDRILRDMRSAQSLPFHEYVRFLAAYGETLAALANAYTSPDVARDILTRYADEALERALDEVCTCPAV